MKRSSRKPETVADPHIKVTYLGKGWGIRCFNPNGTIFMEGNARTKEMIGPVARNLLRMYDKCSFSYSKYADRARHRAWGKGNNKDMVDRQDHIPIKKH